MTSIKIMFGLAAILGLVILVIIVKKELKDNKLLRDFYDKKDLYKGDL